MSDSLRARLVRMACDISNQLRDVTDIDVDDVLEKGTNHFVFVDVRPSAERQVSMIPEAITAEQFESLEVADGKTVVAYCTAGYRSGVYARLQNKQGHSVVNLRGGILAWCDRMQSLQTDKGESTNKVHVYAKMWNLVSPPYEGVW